jgi:hypothetical protein
MMRHSERFVKSLLVYLAGCMLSLSAFQTPGVRTAAFSALPVTCWQKVKLKLRSLLGTMQGRRKARFA